MPVPVNESMRYEIHNRTVVRGSRSKRSTRKFDPFFGLFPAVGATELDQPPLSSIAAWDRLIVGSQRLQREEVNEGDDLSTEKLGLPQSSRNRKRKVQSTSSPSLLITNDEDRSRSAEDVEKNLIDSRRVKTSLDTNDEWRLPQNAFRSRIYLDRNRGEGGGEEEGEVVVGNVPKIDRNLFDTSEEVDDLGEGGEVVNVVDQKTVTADHVGDDLLDWRQLDANEPLLQESRTKRKTEIYSREDVSYVFVSDCGEKPKTRLVPPWKYPLPGSFTSPGGLRVPSHTQDYKDHRHHPRNKHPLHHRPQDHGKYSM